MPKHPAAVYAPYHPLGADIPFSTYVDKGWALRCDCWDCDHVVEIAPADLVQRFGPGATIVDLSPRMVCRCGSRKVHLYAVSAFSRPGQMVAR